MTCNNLYLWQSSFLNFSFVLIDYLIQQLDHFVVLLVFCAHCLHDGLKCQHYLHLSFLPMHITPLNILNLQYEITSGLRDGKFLSFSTCRKCGLLGSPGEFRRCTGRPLWSLKMLSETFIL